MNNQNESDYDWEQNNADIRILVRFIGGSDSKLFAVRWPGESHDVWRFFLHGRMIATTDFDELEKIIIEYEKTTTMHKIIKNTHVGDAGNWTTPLLDKPMHEIIRWGLDRLESMEKPMLIDEARRLQLDVSAQPRGTSRAGGKRSTEGH